MKNFGRVVREGRSYELPLSRGPSEVREAKKMKAGRVFLAEGRASAVALRSGRKAGYVQCSRSPTEVLVAEASGQGGESPCTGQGERQGLSLYSILQKKL